MRYLEIDFRSHFPYKGVFFTKVVKANIIAIIKTKMLRPVFSVNPPPHNGPKSLILAPQDIPEISGYQLGFGCQCVKAYNSENPVTNQKIL